MWYVTKTLKKSFRLTEKFIAKSTRKFLNQSEKTPMKLEIVIQESNEAKVISKIAILDSVYIQRSGVYNHINLKTPTTRGE